MNLVLYTKTMAINTAHQSARAAMDRLSKDLNASISVPTLTDASFNPVTPYNMCAGVSFLQENGPVFQVTPSQTAAASQNTILVTTGTAFTPVAGECLVIPSYQIQQNITSVTSKGGGSFQLTLSSTLGNTIAVSSTNNVVAIIANPVGYAVSNGQLLFYPNTSSTNNTVVARDMSTASGFGPFTIPADYTPPTGQTATQDYSTVAVRLSTQPPVLEPGVHGGKHQAHCLYQLQRKTYGFWRQRQH